MRWYCEGLLDGGSATSFSICSQLSIHPLTFPSTAKDVFAASSPVGASLILRPALQRYCFVATHD